MAISVFEARVLKQKYTCLRVSFNPTGIRVQRCNGFYFGLKLSAILIIKCLSATGSFRASLHLVCCLVRSVDAARLYV